MKTFSDLQRFFDLVVVLNLPSRVDRWQDFQRRLPSDWPFAPPLRFPAIDGRALTRPTWWRGGQGAWGCYLSHMTVYRDCLRNGVESVLILEDDVSFAPDFARRARSYLAHLPDDWQFIYLGGQHIQVEYAGPSQVNDWVYKPFNVNRTHAYALRGKDIIRRVHDFLNLESEWPLPHHIDHRLGGLHKELRSGLYVPRDWLATQAQGRSDISLQAVNPMCFRGAEWLCKARPTARSVAVLSADPATCNLVGGLLHSLGIPVRGPDQDAEQPEDYGDSALKFITRHLFETTSNGSDADAMERERLLRLWAADRADLWKPPHGLIGGAHPFLCFLGDEIGRAWEDPTFIAINGELMASPGSRLAAGDKDLEIAKKLREARQSFLATSSAKLFRLDANRMVSDPASCIATVTSSLGITPHPDKARSAVAFLKSLQHAVS